MNLIKVPKANNKESYRVPDLHETPRDFSCRQSKRPTFAFYHFMSAHFPIFHKNEHQYKRLALN